MIKLYLTYEEGKDLPKVTDEYVMIQCPDRAGYYVMHPGNYSMYEFYHKKFEKYNRLLNKLYADLGEDCA